MTPKSFPRHLVIVWFLGLVLVGAAQVAHAPTPLPRIALVIGNTKYQDSKLGTLRTARIDAEDIAKTLTNLGYQVTTQFDSELSTLHEGISTFSEKLKSDSFRNAVAIVYFAGYGLQKNGRNFLLPTNFDASNESQDMDKATITVDRDLIKNMAGRTGGANMIILDACREDPFGQRQGLAQMDDVPNGTLVELAAEPNNQAIESLDPKAPEQNGVYAKQLLKKLDQPNPDIDLRHFFDIVGNNVYEASNKAQKPRVMTAQTTPAMPEMVSLFQENTPTRASDEELKFWKSVDKSSELCAFEQHLKRFPNGEFADSARATINAIKTKIESAPRAFSELPLELKVQVTQSFERKQAASKAECERKWANGGSDFKASRLAEMRRGTDIWANGFGNQPVFQQLRSLKAKGSNYYTAWTAIGHQGVGQRYVAGRSGYMKASHAVEPQANPAQIGQLLSSHTIMAARDEAVVEQIAHDRVVLALHQPVSIVTSGAILEEFLADLLAAEQGELNAMYRVALIYEDGGHEVAKDNTEMIYWLVLSSSLGNGLASYKLYRYFAGEPTGYAMALKFKTLASKKGYYGPVKLP